LAKELVDAAKSDELEGAEACAPPDFFGEISVALPLSPAYTREIGAKTMDWRLSIVAEIRIRNGRDSRRASDES
jgi:hypothetical protein